MSEARTKLTHVTVTILILVLHKTKLYEIQSLRSWQKLALKTISQVQIHEK